MSSLWPVPWFARPHLRHRITQIVSVLTRHGLGWLLAQFGVGHLSPRQRRLFGRVIGGTPHTQAEHLRMALGELGGAFIKLGQVLSTRADLLPPEYIAELSKLQDAAPPVPFEQVRQTIYEELGEWPENVFGAFDPEPAASASIGQAHSARLKDGREVIVKVRRPGIEAQVEQDLEILRGVSEWAEANTPIGEYYNLADLVDEFAYTLRNELDYNLEGRNADRFRQNFADDEGIYVPHVHWRFTTSKVLTLERVGGIKVSDAEALDRAGIDRHGVAENSVRLMLLEVFEFGFFHADPHPGNFFVRPDGSIALIDFGMVGRVDKRMQEALLRIGLAAVRLDAEALADELYLLGVAGGRAKRLALQRDLSHLLGRYAEGSIKDLAASEATGEVMSIALHHKLQLPSELVMLFRVISVSESIGARLDPNFRLFAFATPYLRDFWQERRSPQATASRFFRAATDATELSLELPRRASRLLTELERGEVGIRVNIEDVHELTRQLHRAVNRLALSLLFAALVVVLGMIAVLYRPFGWEQYSNWLFGAAVLFSLVFGAWLSWSIWRSGRP
ncbi:MAG: AarF/ABC1/UbiB kinase family protein [Chloroflexi bacterium]|nr:AarF/ABC1/UbiB kinase family protein [Chloroflexota bacterium]